MTTEQYALTDPLNPMTREQFAAIYPDYEPTFVGPIHPETILSFIQDRCAIESGRLNYPAWSKRLRAAIAEVTKLRQLVM